jgi:hypothetical protein
VPKFDKNEEDLMRVMFGLAESIADASSSELLDEAKENNLNLLDEAEEVRGVLRAAGRHHSLQKLRLCRRAYETAVETLQSQEYNLPTSPKERASLLRAVIQSRPDIEPMVMTVQHRNFSELSDEDVTNFLKQLKALGLLNPTASIETK